MIEETLRASVERRDACTREAERKFVEPVNCVGTARPLIEETLRVSVDATEAWTRDAEMKFVEPVNCVGTARPLMEETTSWDVQTAPLAVKTPVLIWRDEMDVVMISPILMKPLFEPIARESTTREEM